MSELAPQHFQITITDSSVSVIELLATRSGLSKQQIKQAMQKGAVWRSQGAKQAQRIRRAPKNLKPGESFHLYYNAKVLAEAPPEPLLIADEGDYSVWYKPYGMWAQGSKWGDHCALYRWVETYLKPERPAFLVHRLDRAATGLILVAHSKGMAKSLTQLFEQRQVEKRYQVIVNGLFSGNASFSEPLDGKAAVSHAQKLVYDEVKHQTLLEVRIETGRKHQIRRHLAGAGFPIVGDRLYGPDGETEKDLQLTACYLSFCCPQSKVQRVYSLKDEQLPSF